MFELDAMSKGGSVELLIFAVLLSLAGICRGYSQCNCEDEGFWSTSRIFECQRVSDFLKVGSWDWFCENFQRFQDALEDEKPYDQSFLLAMIAPRYLLVGSAELDRGADPQSEFLTTLHASSAWELLGERGLVTEDKMPVPGDHLGEGNILYHYRKGLHYLSREDWNAYIKFLDNKFKHRND